MRELEYEDGSDEALIVEQRHEAVARTHLADAKARIAKQEELIARLTAGECSTEAARHLLLTMQSALETMNQHLHLVELRIERLTSGNGQLWSLPQEDKRGARRQTQVRSGRPVRD